MGRQPIEIVEPEDGPGLDRYASFAHLQGHVQDLRQEAELLVPLLKDRTVWMVNSTARGGGVAEMLPQMIGLLRELGLSVQWATIQPEQQRFFTLTKRIHNLIHGSGEPEIGQEDREVYEQVSERLADAMQERIDDEDIVVVHDPQPAGMGALLERRKPSLVSLWRCHIGLDRVTPQTEAAWRFLEPWVTTYDHAVFSCPEYIPSYLAGKSTIITPAIDPLSQKNRPLTPHQLVGVLCNAGLMKEHAPVLRPPFDDQAQRLRADGSFTTASEGDEIGLIYRPIVTQISRWDRLKGFKPLLDGFAMLKRNRDRIEGLTELQRRRLDLVRLVLAGPDPSSVQDDPEGKEVLDELCAAYGELEPEIQQDVALLALPMSSARENALMVNALQSCSTVIAQNSLREGFGLTATEAMFKRTTVLASNACGLRQQIRDRIDGRINAHPEEPRAVADLLVEMLGEAEWRQIAGRTAQRRAHDEFLLFAQLCKWLRLLARAKHGTIEEPARGSMPPDAT